jgi:predicted transposase/invertase (TIGR01784 family)
MPRYLDPKSDFVFKKIFGEHKDLLKSFLNALLPLPEGQEIVDLEYISHELAPALPYIKRPIVDVRCCDTMGRSFIVEMQIEWIEGFMQRMLFNAGNSYVRQLQRGKPYPLLKPVYGLAILATSFSEGEEWYHHYRMSHVNDPDNTIEGIELIFVELPKYQIKTAEDRLLRRLWIRFLQLDGGYQDLPEELSKNEEISHALSLLEESAYTPAELLSYEEYWDAIRINTTIKESCLAQGEQIGIAKGKEMGIEEGRIAERKKSVQKLILAGFSLSSIASLLDLSPEEIQQYAQEGELPS